MGGPEGEMDESNVTSIIRDILLRRRDKCYKGYRPSQGVEHGLACPKTFDGWNCWNETAANGTAYSACPFFIHGFVPTTQDAGEEEVDSYRTIRNRSRTESNDIRETRQTRIEPEDPEFEINIALLHFPQRAHRRIFSYFNGNDIKSCRSVCHAWNDKATPFLDDKTTLVFNGEDSPWAFLTPQITHKCIEYLSNSKTAFSHWTRFRITCGSTSQIQPLLSSNFSNTFRLAVRRIKHLHLQTCFLDWDTFCFLLQHFPGLETLFLDQNGYYEHVSFITQVITNLTTPVSPTISSGGIAAEADFLDKFRKYHASLHLKSLRVLDSGVGSHTSQSLQLMCRLLADGCLEDFSITAAGAQEGTGAGLGEETHAKQRALLFWIATGQLLVFGKGSLKHLSISSTHEKAPVNAFDLFLVHCIEPFNSIVGRPVIEYLSLDFKFLWLSSPTVVSELVPFIKSLRQLKNFHLRTIIMKPSWVERLEMLKPSVSHCFFDVGVHVTDIEGESNLSPIIRLMGSDLYQSFMSSLHVSIITQDVLELGQMISTEPGLEYTNLRKFTMTVMSKSFMDFGTELIVRNYPNLTILELSDGPLIATRDLDEKREMGMREHGGSQYGNMSHALFGDEEMQRVVSVLKKLRILSLQCNMNGLTDSGITGLSPDTCALLNRGAKAVGNCVVDLEYDRVGHSLLNLKDLRKLTLRGLGKLLTDVSVHYGFMKLVKLEQLVLYGTLELSSVAKNRLCKRLGDERCQIQIHMPY